jgi:hypothetical protein
VKDRVKTPRITGVILIISARRKEERRAKKKNQPILFLGFWDRFELYAIIVKYFLRLHAFRSSFVQFSEISKKNLVPILIFHLADRFETLSIIVIFASFARCSEHCCLLRFGVAA